MIFFNLAIKNVNVGSESSFLASPLIQHTTMSSCLLQNITHINQYSPSPAVASPFNVTLAGSRWVNCENGLSGGIIHNIEDHTTIRAINTTFFGAVSNGETADETFQNRPEAVDVSTAHSFLSCVFTSCHAYQTSGGAIRCRSGADLTISRCTFSDNSCLSDQADRDRILAVGGAIHFFGNDAGSLEITDSLFEQNKANLGGCVYCERAASFLFKQTNVTKGSTILYSNSGFSYGGGLAIDTPPEDALVHNVRFSECSSEGSGGSFDCSNMTGSVTLSNVFIEDSIAPRGIVVLSWVLDPISTVCFSNCLFNNNTSTAKDDNGVSFANDVRVRKVEPYLSLLKQKSMFVNCFSTSDRPRIAFMDPPIEYTFEFVDSNNKTLLDIHLPDPVVTVNEQEGVDVDGCGTDDSKCRSIAFTGQNRVAQIGGTILIEAGHFTETIAFDLTSKSTTFSSSGEVSPIISIDLNEGESAFITKGTGTVRFEGLSFVPSLSSHIVLQNGNGELEIVGCSFINVDGVSVAMEVSAVKTTEGKVSFTQVSFAGLQLGGGSCVECVGSTAEVTISQSKFVSIEGTASAMIVFSRINAGSGTVTMSEIRVIVEEGQKVGGIQIMNVKTVSMTGMQFANVNSDEQEAAIDIATCSELTLSSLLFERCIGNSASDIIVTNSESISLSSPLDDKSFSTSRSPTSSINGVVSDTLLSRTSLIVNGTSGSDEEFCWKDVGCASITSLLSHVDHSVKWNTTLKEETVGDSVILISNNLQFTMTGTTQAGSILSHTGLVSSPLLSVASGSLSMSQLTLSTNIPSATRSASFFVISGGSASFTSVIFPSLSFSNSGSMLKVSGTGSLSVASVDFSDCSTDGVGSVLHSTSTERISLNTVSLSGNKCGSEKKGRSIAIESTTPIDPSNVIMTNVKITSEGSTGNHEVFMKGPSLPLTVTSSNFGSTLGSQTEQTTTKMREFFGEDTSDASMSGPLSYLLFRHSTGAVSVDVSFWDHVFCGLSALPCKSLEMAHSKVNEADQIVDFVSDVKMTGTIVSKSSGSIITSSSGRKITAESTAQFDIREGRLRLESLTLELPSVLTQALFVVSGGTLDILSTVTLTNPTTTAHTSSFLSVSGGTVVLDGTKLTTTQKLTLTLSALIGQTTGSLTISNMKFENITRESGDGSVISATLTTNTDKLAIVSTTFTSCSCSAGNGGALAVSLTASALFSITKSSLFTSCTASGKGSKLYLSRLDLLSFVSAGNLDSIKPTLTTKAAADGILNEFYGFELSSSEGSLLLYWYPFSTDDTTMHVHSSGHAHSLCGKEALPCKTLPDSLSKIQKATTIMIDTNMDLSSKLTSLASEWTLSSSGSFMVTVTSEGQIEVKDDQSNLTMSSLSLFVGTLSSERTTELVSVSAGLLVLSSCTVFSSTSNLPVSFVALSGGIVLMTATTLNIPTIRSQPVISVTGGKLEVDSSTSLVNLDAVTHEASLVSIGGGEIVLDGASLTTLHAMTFASSALIVQTKGSLRMSSMKFENISRTTGDGSVISASLTLDSDKLSIVSTSFKSCSCFNGNGGALAVSLSSSALFSITGTSPFTSCSASGKGSKLYLSRPSLISFLTTNEGTGPLDSIKPTLTTKAAADGILNEFYGFELSSSEGSLLLYWYPFSSDDTTMHVHSSGHAHSLCGKEALPCKTLPDSLSKIHSADTLMIDTNIELSSKLTSLSRSLTLTKSGSAVLTFDTSGQLDVTNSGSVLTLSSLLLEVGTLTSGRLIELITVSAGSLVVSSCTVFASTPSLSVSFVSLSNGEVSFPDSTMNIPTLTSKPFLSVSGGTLNVDSSTSLANSNTDAHQTSLLSVSGGTVALDGTKLSTTKKLTLASSALMTQSKGSLTISNMKIENITRESGDGSLISATLSTNTDKLSIVSTTFTSCSCSAGNGGALFVSLTSTAFFSITGTSSFTSCTASGKGNNLYLIHPNLASFASTGTLDAIKPTLPATKAETDAILNEFYGFESASSESSLLFFWFPHSVSESSTHIHGEGSAHPLCGRRQLPCSTISTGLTHPNTKQSFVVDSPLTLAEYVMVTEQTILTAPIPTTVTVTQSGRIGVPSHTLTLSNLFFVGSAMMTSYSFVFFSSTGSLSIDSCSINNHNSSWPGSAISASLAASSTLTLLSSSFVSCTSLQNGGALAVTVTSGSLSLHSCRFEKCSSEMNGGAVWLDLSQMPTLSQYSLLQTQFGTGSSANKASGMGDCVFVLGEDLRRVVVGSRWRGSFEEAGEDDLWGSDQKTTAEGTSLLTLLKSQVIGVGEGGLDDAAGTMDAPFKTLNRCFEETSKRDGSFAVVVVERARIGESCWLVDQPGWAMEASGSGGGGSSQSVVLCSVSDEEKKPGTPSSSARHAMITLGGQSLSFSDILFSSFSAPRTMGFVFSLLGSSQLTLSSCSLSSSSPITVSLVSVSGSSSFSADSLSMNEVSFVGKAGLVKFGDASIIALTSCSFISISLEGGALMWGTTRGGMKVTNTEFTHCTGKEFGSVIRTKIVGISASITNCNFTSCSTHVRVGETSERSVIGGGCVVVELMKRTSSTRRLPSSCIDLSLSSFSDCTLTNTDTSQSSPSFSLFVGGSGFLIFGNEKNDCVILRKVTLYRCLCRGFEKMNGFDGGVVVGRGHALFTDRRGSSIRECKMGSIQLR
ncbi:hypothetical protein BLNAU_19555 [Blattamonas nauphoetae]|uniref:Uncharacterized protein n=1 Tax=Blattamonas nauphoetae TaxID=2049346 RepID=A0ABQ9X172_9EUKA|nr:hypothetical protein BLNAU_19555 [Blattamonas nauphoetae]